MLKSESELTSRQNVRRGRLDHSAGSRDAGTQYNPRTEIVRLPSGSIAQISSFEPIYVAKPRLNEPLVLALLFNCLLWLGFALVLRALFF